MNRNKCLYVSVTLITVAASALAWTFTRSSADQANPRATGKPAVALPIAQVVLFNSGVGYVQREGDVTGDVRVELTFPTSDVNDLLKSLVLQDTGGGRIGAVSYDSQDPVDKTLQSFAIDLNQNPTYAQIRNQARGEKIDVMRQDKPGAIAHKVTGNIVGIETHGQAAVKDELLNLLGSEGMLNIPLAQVLSVRFQNQTLEDDFHRALRVLAGTHDVQKKTVALQFNGNGKRAVKVGYVIEKPIWKTTYRLVIEPNGKLFMQGWAIVENTSDDDWNNIRMVLVSGKPISFRMDHYQPLYVPRPLVEPELFASLRPPVYGGSLAAQPALRPGQAGARPDENSAPEKLYTFQFSGAKWDQVLDWFRDISGLTFMGDNIPTGMVNIIPSINTTTGKPKQYTVGQIVDVLNEHLIAQKWLLLRREQSFMIWPADQPLPLESVRLITVDQLGKGGLAKSEYVRLTYQLQSLQAETFASGIQKMMSPFGRVIPLEEPNQIILIENVANLRIIIQTIREIDRGDSPGQYVAHKCVYVRAGYAAEKLRDVLGDPDRLQKAILLAEKAKGGVFGAGFTKDGAARRAQTAKPHFITFDEQNNIVYITGPADKVYLAKYIMAELDKPGVPTPVGPPTLKTYTAPNGNAVEMAKVLQDIYKASTTLRITAVSKTEITVYAQPADHLDIAAHLSSSQAGSVGKAMSFEEMMKRKQLQSELALEARQTGSAIARLNLRDGMQSIASSAEIGDYFQYVIDQKVSLARQKSAMLPILNQTVAGSKVSIFNEAIHAKYALLGIRLENNSGKPLTQGPITVYEDGSYAGDTRTLDLQPNEERLLSYAVDQGMEFTTTVNTHPAQEMTFKIGGNNLTAVYTMRQTKNYTVKNRTTHDRKLIIEHPIRDDWKLVEPQKPSDRSRDVYRFEVEVKAGQTINLDIVEEQTRTDPVGIISSGKDVPLYYAIADGIEIRPDTKSTGPKLLALGINKGVLEATYREKESKTYFIQNQSDRDHVFEVAHIIRKEWKRLGHDGKTQAGPDVFSFKVEVKSKKTAHEEVVEERVFKDQGTLAANLTDTALRRFIAHDAVAAPVKAAMQSILDKQGKLSAANLEIADAKSALKILAQDQGRVRENLKIIPQTSEYYKNFLKKFVAQEAQIEDAQRQIRTQEAAVLRMQKEYEAFVNGLTLQ